MAARYSRFFRATHITGDVFILNFSFYLLNSVYYNDLFISFTDHYVKQFIYINLFWGISASILRIYDLYRVVRIESIIIQLLKTFAFHLLLCFAFVVFFKEKINSYRLFSFKYSTFVLLTLSWRIGFMFILKFLRTRGLNFRNVVILGTGPVAIETYDFFVKHPEHGYHFLGFFENGMHREISLHQPVAARPIGELKQFALENNVDEIYCAIQDVDYQTVGELMKFSDDNLIRFKLLPDFRGFAGKKLEINFYDHIPVLMARKEPLDNLANRVAKRFFDIFFSLGVLILIFPWLLPLVALLIKVSSPGPVFFKQWRSGLNNRPFVCYKFRTMRPDNHNPQQQATKDDPRVTKIGRILRKTSLDELPQFFNVLKSDMSVVGPRPHMIQHTEKYSKLIESFMVRHFVKPGITGLAQVRGFRGETTDPSMMKSRVRHDIWYIENWSFLLDLKLIFLTIFNVFKGEKNAV